MVTCFLQQAYTRRARDLVNFQFTAPPHMKIHSFMYSYPNKLHPSEYKYTHIQSVSQPVDQQTFCLCQLVVRRSKSCCVGYDVAVVAVPQQPLLIIGIGGQIYLFNVASRQPVQPQATTAYLRQGLTKWWRSFAATRQEILMYAAWQFGLLVKFVKLVKFIKSQICFMMSSSDCVCVSIQIGFCHKSLLSKIL